MLLKEKTLCFTSKFYPMGTYFQLVTDRNSGDIDGFRSISKYVEAKYRTERFFENLK